MAESSELARMLGPDGEQIALAMRKAHAFLIDRSTAELLRLVGRQIEKLPPVPSIGKDALQESFRSKAVPAEDFLAGRGVFYLTEGRRLMLDCTAGHYQMTWGYEPPRLIAALVEAMAGGVVWDNHSNIPQAPVKQLARRLLAAANPPDAPEPLDTVHLGCCTGSVAAAAALKMQLLHFEATHAHDAAPVMIVLDGNYHGTDVVVQRLRGMWDRYVADLRVVAVQPNDADELAAAFRGNAPNVAAFWAEPVMMNREAIPLDAEYLRAARRLCDESGALMCIDEIQTGFWQPEVFVSRAIGVVPDLLIAGKGMTAGFHPLAAVLYKRRLDRMDQYMAISTNGSAALPAFVALVVLDMIAAQAGRIAAAGDRLMAGLRGLAAKHAGVLADARGLRHLAGLKFRDRQAAIDTHRRAVESGLWLRAHAYHQGHSTILVKPALCADEAVVDALVARLDGLLQGH
jgi:acetylornithine/N-succinyldiaminopimelate aminotransferase